MWAPGVQGAVVLSMRGGDFVLDCGQDLSIGYLDHTAETVRLVLRGEHQLPRHRARRRHRPDRGRGLTVTDELAWLDATGQAELVRKGIATPAELLEAAIARIETLNPRLNAVITELFDKAMAAARSGQDGPPDGPPDGPFRGVPFLVKDAVCATAGDPYHCGMQVLKDAGWKAAEDTWLARRFRAAGFLICGKTNLPELATSITTEPLAYGPTRNPWDTDRSPGGSSGGSAAAVASGMVAVAHGNDMGGSIRIPAAHCGLVGLKPTRARSTLGPEFGEFWGPTTHEHVLTRTVRDTAGVLDAASGMAPGDPYTAPPPSRPWRDEVGADPGRLRIGWRTTGRGEVGQAHPDCVAAVATTARLLESLGHDVAPATVDGLDRPGLDESFGVIVGAALARDVERWSARLHRQIRPDELEPMNAMMAEMGRSTTATQYVAAVETAQAWSRGVAAWWDAGHDILVTPTAPEPPPAIGDLGPNAGLEVLGRLSAMVTFTVPFNVTGQPAISLPIGWSAEGLPIGVQLVAGYGREDLLIRVAAQLEQASPWSHRRPAVSADTNGSPQPTADAGGSRRLPRRRGLVAPTPTQVALERDRGPDRLDHPERPRTGQEAVAARQHAAGGEGQDEAPAPTLEGVHRHHEREGNDAIDGHGHAAS